MLKYDVIKLSFNVVLASLFFNFLINNVVLLYYSLDAKKTI